MKGATALKVRTPRNLAELNKAGTLYTRADEEWREGRARSAFRLFLSAARAGATPALGIVAQFYDQGYGVRTDPAQALRWYREAHRHGDHSVANNIGCILRDQGKLRQAISWYERAARAGDGDANLNIAKIHLNRGSNKRAADYLRKTCSSPWATQGSKEEAGVMLKALTAQKPAPHRGKAQHEATPDCAGGASRRQR